MTLKHFFIFCLVVGLIVGITGCGSQGTGGTQKPPAYSEMSNKDLDTLVAKGGAAATQEAKRQASAGAPWAKPAEPAVKDPNIDLGGPRVVIETNRGRFAFVMFPKKAPKTVENFIKLTKANFYNGIKWHAVKEGDIIVGGDPLTKQANPKDVGTGGPGYTIKAEFNDIHNVRGTVGMLHAKDPNSGGSQFYICLRSMPVLDGNFTVFGQVVEGLNVLDLIKQNDVMNKVYIEEGQDQSQDQDQNQDQGADQ